MKLEKIATQPVVALNPADTLNSAIQQMWRLNIEHLPIIENGRPVGMISERDILLHCCRDAYAAHELTHKDPKPVTGSSRVDDIMTAPIVSLGPDQSVEAAANLMLREKTDAIPLVDRDSIVGIVTQTDILKCYLDESFLRPCKQLAQQNVVNFMQAHVFSVTPDDLKPTVIRLMRDKQIRHLPVVDGDGVLVGLVAESDVLLGCKLDRNAGMVSVPELSASNHFRTTEIMSEPIVLDLSGTLHDVARLMITHRIGCVPITSDEQLVGIVTNTDLIRAFAHLSE